MSRTIDERIVQMTFNNKNFEQNAQQSIKTLERLNKSVDPNVFSKSLDALENSARKLNLKPITASVQSVSDSFSILEQIATGALLNIGKKASDLGIKIVKSLSIDQITTAWQKYGAAISSEQTIMSAVAGKISETTGETYDINSITDRIAKLQWYTDETSYNISQMTSAIGSFTSAGIDLDKATQAIIGISNACADAGVDSSKAEHAFLGFSKAISDAMTLSVWNNQLKTSGLTNSERFKQSLIDAGVAAGTLQKISEGVYKTTSKSAKSGVSVTLASITEAFTDTKWANSEVMMKALNSYSDTVDRLYDMTSNGEFDTASEAIKALTDEYVRAGEEVPKSLAAFTRAQEAISFEQAIQSVKDAVSSKWSQTFELIFGNYEEAKELWTTLANEMWEWFASGGDERNDLLKQWHDGISEFEKQLELKDFNTIEDKLNDIKETITELTGSDPIVKGINYEKSYIKLFSAMMSRDVSSIGKAVTDVYDEFENLDTLQDYFSKYGLSDDIDDLIKKRAELLDSEEDETKKLEIINDYYKEIGERIKESGLFSDTFNISSSEELKKSEEKIKTYEELSKILKEEVVDSNKLIDLWKKDGETLFDIFNNPEDRLLSSTYEEISKLTEDKINLYENAEKIESLYKTLAEATQDSTNFNEIFKLEEVESVITSFQNALDKKDGDELLRIWGENSKILLENLNDFPKSISDLQNEIDSLNKKDFFTNQIEEFTKSLEDADEKDKKLIEDKIKLIEDFNAAIKNDSVIDFYKNNGKELEAYFEEIGLRGNVWSIIENLNKIQNDNSLSKELKEWYLGEYYEELEKEFKNLSFLDEQAEKQKELNEELLNFFIEGKSGYKYFIEGIKSGLTNITNIVSTIKDAWKEIFPSMSAGKLIDFTKAFKEFMENISFSEESLEEIKNIFKSIFSILTPIVETVKMLWSSFIVPLAERITPIFSDVYSIIKNLADLLYTKTTNLTEKVPELGKVFERIIDTLQPLINIIKSVTEWIKDLTDNWLNSANELSEDKNDLGKKNIFIKILDSIRKAFEYVEQLVTGGKPIIERLQELFGTISKGIKNFIKKMWDDLESVITDNNLFSRSNHMKGDPLGIIGFFTAIKMILQGKWFAEEKDVEINIFKWIFDAFKNIKEGIGKIPDLVQGISEKLYDLSSALSAFWTESITDSIKNMAIGMVAIAGAVWILASIPEDNMSRSLAAITWIALILGGLLKLAQSLNKGSNSLPVGGIGGIIQKILGTGSGNGKSSAIINNAGLVMQISSISIGLIAIAGALKMLDGIDPTSLTAGVIALGSMMLVIFKLIESINNLTNNKVLVKKFGGKASSETGKALKNIGKTIEQIAFSMLIISASIKLLSGIEDIGAMYASVGALSIVLGAIGVFLALVSKFSNIKDPKVFTSIGKSVEQIAVGLLIISASIKWLSGEDFGGMISAISALGLVLLEIGLFVKGMTSISKDLKGNIFSKIASSMVVFSVSLAIIAGVIKKLSGIAGDDLSYALLAIGGLLLEIWLFTKSMSGIGEDGSTSFLDISSSMLIFSGALLILSGALTVLSKLSFTEIGTALLSIAGVMALIGGFAYIFTGTGLIKAMLAFSASFLAIGAAVYLVCAGLSNLVPLLMLLSVQSESVAVGISNTMIAVFETILTLIPAFVAGLVNGILEFATILLREILVKLPEWVMDVLVIIETFIHFLAQGIRNESRNIGEALGDLVEALMEGFIKALAGFMDGFLGMSLLGDFVDGLFGDRNKGEGLFGVVASSGGQAGETVVENFGSAVEENKDEAIEPAEAVGQEAAEAMEDYDGAVESGKNTLLGLIDTFDLDNDPTGYLAQLKDNCIDIGSKIPEWINTGQEAHSPSRATMRSGTYAIQGLILGVESMSGDLYDSSFGVGKLMTKAISDAEKLANDITSDGVHPTISPVLDLTDIEKGTNRISSLFGDNSSYKAALSINSNGLRNSDDFNYASSTPVININFEVNQAGGELTEADISRYGRQIADEVNLRLGKMFRR